MDPRVERYRRLAPFTLEELVNAANAVLGSHGLAPVSPRTVRYYISEGLIPPPEGARKIARYGYASFLALLAARSMQALGWDLRRIESNLSSHFPSEERLLARVAELLESTEPRHAVTLDEAPPSAFEDDDDLEADVWHEVFLSPRIRLQYRGRLTTHDVLMAEHVLRKLHRRHPGKPL
jgi:DNA-binding transcriptional MerR regulator